MQKGVSSAADGTLAGGIICLLAFLPHLVDKKITSHEPAEAHESHRLMTDIEANPNTRLDRRNSQPSDPEMSFVDLSSGLKDLEDENAERARLTRDGGKSSSSFKAYLNPMNMATPGEDTTVDKSFNKKDSDEVKIQPALMPQV